MSAQTVDAAEMRGQLNALKALNDGLQATVDSQQTQITGLQAQVDAQQTQMVNMNSAIADLQDVVSALQG
jgi:hypothetical protein